MISATDASFARSAHSITVFHVFHHHARGPVLPHA